MTSFPEFSARKIREAQQARITPLRTIDDRSGTYTVRPAGNAWTTSLYDGPFHLWPVPGTDLPAVSLVFIQSLDGNTGAENPADLGGGDTDKHLIYEGLSRVAVNGVLSGATTADGPDVFFSTWHPELVALRREFALPRHPAQIIVSRRGRIDVDRSLIFNVPDAPVFVLGSAVACAAIGDAARKRSWVQVLALESGGLKAALARLRLEYGVERISAIGGRTIATALIDEGLVQDVYLTTTERRGGEPGTPWYSGEKTPTFDPIVVKRGTDPDHPIRFEHLAVT